MYKFISPLKVKVTKTKHFLLNLNAYRNTHYRILNQAKINYKEIMREQIESIEPVDKMFCIYTLYPGTKREQDIGNVCSIHQKFFEDAFVELGKIEDDNYKFNPISIFKFGCIDKEEPRVEIDLYYGNELNELLRRTV